MSYENIQQKKQVERYKKIDEMLYPVVRQMIKIYQGLLSLHTDGDADHILFLSPFSRPIAEELEIIHDKKVSVRYWVTDKEITIEEANELTALISMGIADVDYGHVYSEITGYLWTNEDLKIGGHDLLEELRSNIGKWLILEVKIHD
jgi:hypothetical protein